MFATPVAGSGPALTIKANANAIHSVSDSLEASPTESPVESPTSVRQLTGTQGSHGFLACGLLADELADLAELELALGSPKVMSTSPSVQVCKQLELPYRQPRPGAIIPLPSRIHAGVQALLHVVGHM